jgi:hypothetical protein
VSEPPTEPLIPSGLPWIATVGLFVLVGAKVISVSYGSQTTATALIASSGPLAVVMGTLVFQLGSIGVWVMLMLGIVGERRALSNTDRVIVRGLAVDRVFGSPVMRWLLKRGWLPSLRSKEDPLLGRVKKVHDALQSFAERAQVESLLARLDDVQNRQESRAHRIQAGEEVAAQLDTAKSELDAVKSELDAVTSEFSALGSELDALEPEVRSRSDESDRQTARYSSFEAIFLAAIGALTLFLYLLPTPWIAPQRIELADGMQFVGYVVSDEGATDTVVLTDVDRRVLMIPSNASV